MGWDMCIRDSFPTVAQRTTVGKDSGADQARTGPDTWARTSVRARLLAASCTGCGSGGSGSQSTLGAMRLIGGQDQSGADEPRKGQRPRPGRGARPRRRVGGYPMRAFGITPRIDREVHVSHSLTAAQPSRRDRSLSLASNPVRRHLSTTVVWHWGFLFTSSRQSPPERVSF